MRRPISAPALTATVLGIALSAPMLTAQQVPYVVSGGIGGLFLLGVGGMLWLSADLRDEWRKLDSLEQRLPEPAATDEPDLFAAAEPGNANGSKPRRQAPLRAGGGS